MKSNKLSSFSAHKLLYTIIKYGSIILAAASIIVLCLLSFVENIGLSTDFRDVTVITLVALVLNCLLWDTFYKDQYSKVLFEDINAAAQKKYSVHKRYYDARKGYTQAELRAYIRKYNKDFVDSWLQDVEDITGRKIDDIEKESYKHNTHKLLIWRIKHHRYPNSGLHSPQQLLTALSIGQSQGLKLHTNAAEKSHTSKLIVKILTSALTTFLAAAITYNFITDAQQAILKLVLSILLIFLSILFGATSGVKGGQTKLSTAEQICELLEEWKGKPIDFNKYGDVITEENSLEKTEEKTSKKITPTIEIG